jgi:Ca2+-binding EF-hand superfamily protein
MSRSTTASGANVRKRTKTAERTQAERAGLRSRSAYTPTPQKNIALRNPVLSRKHGTMRTSVTPTIKRIGRKHSRSTSKILHTHSSLPFISSPSPPRPSTISKLPNRVSLLAAEALNASIAAAGAAAEEAERAAAAAKDALLMPKVDSNSQARATKAVAAAAHYMDDDSSGTDWDSDMELDASAGDGDIDLSRPYTTANRKLKPELKYFGGSGKQYLADSYKSVSQKRLIRRNVHNTDELHNRPATACRRFVDTCHRLSLSPEPFILRKTHTIPAAAMDAGLHHETHATDAPDHAFHHHSLPLAMQSSNSLLSLKHYGIGNIRAAMISESLSMLPGLAHLDMSDCRLNDAAVSQAVNMIGYRPIQSLDLSQNSLGMKSAKSLARALLKMPLFMHIELSRCNLDDKSVMVLCKSLAKNHTCTALNLSHNEMGAASASIIGRVLQTNCVLTDLNVAWNRLGPGQTGVNFISNLPGSYIRKLDIAMNSFGGGKRNKGIDMLGKVLPDTAIEELNVSGNHISPLATCILMNGVSLHPPLSRLMINENPIGQEGASAVLRAMDCVVKQQERGGGQHLDVDMYGCSCDTQGLGSYGSFAAFDFLEPAGAYELDLGTPEDYALACEILRMLNTRNGYSAKTVQLRREGSKAFKRVQVRRKNRKANALSGLPSSLMDRKTGEIWKIPKSGTLKIEIVVREHIPKEWNAISDTGYAALLDLIKEQKNYLSRMAVLDAACNTFFFTGTQVREIARCFAGYELKHVMPKLLMRVLDNEDSEKLLEENRHLLTGQLAMYQPHVATGRYVLDLSSFNDRNLAIILMRNSNDDRAEAKLEKEHYFDLSQLGDESNFRNVSLDGEPYLLSGILDDQHKLPKRGILCLDYVDRTVMEAGTEAPEQGPSDDDIRTEITFRKYLFEHTISCAQLLEVVMMLPKPKDWMTLDGKITALFHLLDDDDGGEVDKHEVMRAIIDRPEVGDFMCQIPELEPLLEPRTFGPAFDAIDQDGGGSLDIDEFRQMCGVANDLAAVAQEMFDADSDDEWDASEDLLLREKMKEVVKNKLNSVHKMLRQQMKDGTPPQRFDAVYQLFHEMDEGHKDYLMPQEFGKLTASLGIILSDHELADAVKQIDEDGNGQIEVDEYLDWWGDAELIELYEARVDALESGKPYRMMSDKVAGESAAERLSIVRQLFTECDENNKDYLEPKEFQILSEQLGVKLLDPELDNIIAEIDEDGNGQIEVDEYLAWWGDEELIELYEKQMAALEEKKPYRLLGDKISKKANTRRKRLTCVSDLFDRFDDGAKEYLTPKEFDKLSRELGVFLSPTELSAAIDEIDEDGNGQIEVDEYLTWWGDPELLELFEADEEGITIPSVELEDNEAEDVMSSEDENDDGDRTKEEEKDDDDDEIEDSPYETAYPSSPYLKHSGFQRVDYIVAAHQRLIDLHNFAYLWEFLSKGEVLATLHRLGWLNVFDPVSPDRRHYMDLDIRETQLIAMILVRLAVVEPGENWLYEDYMHKPGWQLPMSWMHEIPKTGRLTLTYSSTAKGCAPVWEERVALRKYCLIPNDAPLPHESGGMASLKASAAPITYPMFIRLMTSPESTIDTIGQAKEDAKRMEEEKKRQEDAESDLDDDDDDGGGGGNGDDNNDEDNANTTSPVKPEPSQEGEPASPAEASGDAEAAAPGTKKKAKFRAPKSKGERNAYAFLETHKKSFLRLRTDNDDLEECLEVEWDSFCSECEGRLAEDRNLTNAFRMLRSVFENLAW